MIGHEWARDLLARAAQRGRLGHAYLFAGPPSVGKTALALRLAGMLVCTGPLPRPCGTCRACKLLARNSHPDVRLIERAADRRDITIEQVRAIEEEIGLAPFEAAHKLFCLAGADTLNDAAASALLKTLEEPPSHATLVLCAADPSALPITVRSRCQQVMLQPVPAQTTAEGLAAQHGIEPDRAHALALLARGRPGWAVTAIGQPELVDRARAAFTAVATLARSGPYTRLMLVDEWLGKGTSFVESRERALAFLALLEGWWRDALLASQEHAAPRLRDYLLGDVDRPACTPAEIVAFLVRIQEAAARVEANVVPRLVLEHVIGAMPGAREGARHA
jgi:DNA polymerase-3 subunit delta'